MANWGGIGSRGNVEDRRGLSPVAIGGVSLTGLAIMMLFSYATGGNPLDVLTQIGTVPLQQTQQDTSQFEGQDSYEVFASTVLGSSNDAWSSQFAAQNRTYTPPKLVLFRTATSSECGTATSQIGPHYCPIDSTIYLDETFFDELTTRLGAEGGDVAEAYVIAHEVGHHVQKELGTMDLVEQSRFAEDANDISVKLELQADCYAGIWANSVGSLNVFGPGEIGEAMDAAAAVGDDRIQSRTSGSINPENWTHGSSQERVQWFSTGYETGSLEACDTF